MKIYSQTEQRIEQRAVKPRHRGYFRGYSKYKLQEPGFKGDIEFYFAMFNSDFMSNHLVDLLYFNFRNEPKKFSSRFS